MNNRSNRNRKFHVQVVELLEARAYLTGVVLGAPVNLSTASAGIDPVFANLADFNGDGQADLFIANSTNSVSVLTGRGDGSFNAPSTMAVSGAPLPLAVGNFTNSGNLDIVAGTTGSPGSISIIRGNGDGTFQAANNIPALASNHALAVADFNKDGNLDVIAVSNSGVSNNAAIILGDGAGGASAPATIFSIPHTALSAVVTGDFNGDGNADFAVADQADSKITVYLGNGDGTFRAPTDFATGVAPTSIVAGDFNGDGRTDIITADSNGGTVSFLQGVGDGTFLPPVKSAVAGSASGGGPLKVRVTDFNGDNKPDLLVLLSHTNSGDATVLLGNGNGTFHTGTIIATGGATRDAIAAGDLNGDGLTDAVVTDSTQISALLNVTNQDTSTPTASVDSTQSPASNLSHVFDFTVTYSDAKQIDADTLGDGNLVVTFPDGVTTQAATLVSTNLGNAATLHATYQITFSGNLGNANEGVYQVAINANSVENAHGIAVPAGNIGAFTLTVDAAPIASVDSSQAAPNASSNVYAFAVTYTANSQINVATLGDQNLVVTFPDGVTTQAATLVSSDPANASTIHATYRIVFSANLSAVNNGTYHVAINANSVRDTDAVAVPAGSIGTFSLSLSTAPQPVPSGDFTVTAPTGKILGTVVAGSKQKGGVNVAVINTSGARITGTVTVTLYTSSTTIHDSSAVAVGRSITRKVKKLKSGKGFKVHFKAFQYPATAGTYFLVADAALNGNLDSSDGATSAITVNPAVVDANAVSAVPKTLILEAGKKAIVQLKVQNVGNVVYKGPATVTVVAQGTSDLTQTQLTSTPIPVKLNLNPSQTKTTRVSFDLATLPAAGQSYQLILTITMPGDTNSVNDSVTTTIPVSV